MESVTHRCLPRKGYKHGPINHAIEQWKKGIFCTNGIEGFWGDLKKGISSTHIHVSREYLQNYVDEFQFRYNNRKEPYAMFSRLLALISKAR